MIGSSQELGVELIPPPPKTAVPGDFVTQVFIVINRGTAEDTYGFSVTLPQGFLLVGTLPPLTLAPAEEGNVFITIWVPATAGAGAYSLELRATSQTDPAVTATATAIIEVLPVAGVEVRAPPSRDVEPGEEVVLPFTVINRGNVIDTFELAARSRRGFEVTVSEPFIDLLPGEGKEVLVTLKVPVDAAAGIEEVTLIATSTTRRKVSGSASVLLTVLPPLPERVPTELFLKAPAQLTLRLSGPLPGGPLTPGLRLLAGTGFSLGRLDLTLEIEDLYRAEITKLLFNFRDTFSFTIGDLPGPAQLIGVSGRGIRVGFYDLASLSLVRVDTDKKGFLAQLASGDIRVALSSLTIPGPPEQGILDVLFCSRMVGFAEVAMGDETSASLFHPSIKIDDITLGAEFKRADKDFPGSINDIEGLSLFLRVSAADILSLSALVGTSNDNVAQDPTLPTVNTLTSQFSSRLTLADLPSVGMRLNVVRKESTGPPPLTDSFEGKLSISVGQTGVPISFSLLGERGKSIDNVAGTEFDLTSLTGVVRTSQIFGRVGIATRIGAAVSTKTDATSGALVESSSKISAGLTYYRLGSSLSIGFALEDSEPSLSTRLTFIAKDFSASLQGNIKGAGLDFQLSTRFGFDLPFAFIVEKGRVEGVAFVDADGNGHFDPGEGGVPGLILSLDGTLARTGPSGLFRFPPLSPGKYELDVRKLPLGLVPTVPLPLKLTLKAGDVLKVEIPLAQVGVISGLVFNDLDKDGQVDPGEGGIAAVRLTLTGPVAKETRTGSDGRFSFQVSPGSYTVSLDPRTLPRRFKLTTPGEVSVTVGVGEIRFVQFGAAEIMPIKFAPIAEFTFRPERPRPGETVTFDASASYDPDGTIVGYDWDLDADGEPDATGKVVAWTFPQRGEFPVTLTVTDNDGNRDSATKTVIVD